MSDEREPIEQCEGCMKHLFEGDRYHHGVDVALCEECAPAYSDLISAEVPFSDGDEGELSQADRQAIYDAHLAAGGLPTDKLIS